MGVEGHNLYTADVTRTLPVDRAPTPPSSASSTTLVLKAQQAGIDAVRPGVPFLAAHDAAMEVLAHALDDMGLLPVSAEEALDPDSKVYSRWTLHGTSHMLGMDVHDCGAAAPESYREGTLAEGMVLTVEPGLYFQEDDLLVPEELRGIGIRIEDDILVTADGVAEPLRRPAPRGRGRRGVDGPADARDVKLDDGAAAPRCATAVPRLRVRGGAGRRAGRGRAGDRGRPVRGPAGHPAGRDLACPTTACPRSTPGSSAASIGTAPGSPGSARASARPGPRRPAGSLASYVSPRFIEANAQFVSDPERRRAGVRRRAARPAVAALLADRAGRLPDRRRGASGSLPRRHIHCARSRRAGRRVAVGRWWSSPVLVTSALVAVQLFQSWEGDDGGRPASYPMSDIDDLSFSNPEALEIAEQVQPFIVKNTDRIQAKADAYEAATDASLRRGAPANTPTRWRPATASGSCSPRPTPRAARSAPGCGTEMYPLLEEYLGEDAFAMRTISGDISSNGTVAEQGFVQDEAAASPEIPAGRGQGRPRHRHHRRPARGQRRDCAGLRGSPRSTDFSVVAANDPAFKTLFGGMVVNDTGITETELGADAAREDDEDDADDPLIVLFHQPRSAAGYIGIDALDDLVAGGGRGRRRGTTGSPTCPRARSTSATSTTSRVRGWSGTPTATW